MIGRAWLALASELEQALQEDDPSACVEPWVDAGGTLRFKVAGEPGQRHAARAAVRRFESRAATVCEACGGELSRTRCAPGMAVYVCSHCLAEPAARGDSDQLP